VAAACSVVPFVDGVNQDPKDSAVEVGRPLQTAGVALGDTVPEVAQAEGHGAYGGKGYPSARLGAAAHRLRVQMGGLRLGVRQLLREGDLLAPPFRPWGAV
jgi:hypothetical protein